MSATGPAGPTDHRERLERLAERHAAAVEAFELANREWFAASISDRGDAWFASFADRFAGALVEQETGSCAFFVVVDDHDNTHDDVLGRFNLYDIADGTASVGYRVARHAAGRGLATAMLGDLCARAAGLGLHTLTATVSHDNAASRAVLARNGFEVVGDADPAGIGGRAGLRLRRGPTSGDPRARSTPH